MINQAKEYRILIVDDQSINIQVVASILKQCENYRVAFAKNGKAALEQVQTQKFDLILLDIMMPEMDGFEVSEKLKANEATAKIPIIFLTALTDEDSIVRAFDNGAVDYITKPFNKAELVARVKTHLRLKTIEEELFQANSTKDKMFSIIGHDLRGPIGNIKTMLHFLGGSWQKVTTNKIESLLQMAERSVENVYNLLENLLYWSRTQRGNMVYMKEHFPIVALIDETLSLLSSTAKIKEISFEKNISNDIKVYADIHSVTTVLRNLISNSIKFTESGGKIIVETQTTDKFVTISVSDNGVGMSEAIKQKLFNKFSSVSTFGTNHEKGSGLGLLLCKEFVENNGGEIWVESEEMKGSKFSFTIPRFES